MLILGATWVARPCPRKEINCSVIGSFLCIEAGRNCQQDPRLIQQQLGNHIWVGASFMSVRPVQLVWVGMDMQVVAAVHSA